MRINHSREIFAFIEPEPRLVFLYLILINRQLVAFYLRHFSVIKPDY